MKEMEEPGGVYKRNTLESTKLRASLKNEINNVFSVHGSNLEKDALSSEKKLNEILAMIKFDPIIRIKLKGDCGTDPQPEPEHR